MALKSAEKARGLAGNPGLLNGEATEWQCLAAARSTEQQVQGSTYRVKVVDPK